VKTAVWIGALLFARIRDASPGASIAAPESTRTIPSSVSKAVSPLTREANQVRSATSTGPPDQKNLASSGGLPAMVANRLVGFGIEWSVQLTGGEWWCSSVDDWTGRVDGAPSRP